MIVKKKSELAKPAQFKRICRLKIDDLNKIRHETRLIEELEVNNEY